MVLLSFEHFLTEKTTNVFVVPISYVDETSTCFKFA